MMSYLRLYAQQRLLYRISVSPHAQGFCLKGGVMLAAYNDGALFRSSEDIDFNGSMEGGIDAVERAVRAAVAMDVPDDGVTFDLSRLRMASEHVGSIKGGKLAFDAYVHTARIPLRVDVGFNNVITPEPRPIEIPTLLPSMVPCPVISGYPLETIVAEKLHAVRQFGMDNTRHKDLYDLWRIRNEHVLDGSTVADAISRTFEHHGSRVETGLPGLSQEYAIANTGAWNAFLRKNGLRVVDSFTAVMGDLRDFADPLLECASGGPALGRWTPKSGWDLPAPISSLLLR